MYKIIVDSAGNLTEDLLDKYDIEVIPFKCTIDGNEYICYEPGRNDDEDGKWFYDNIRNGNDVRTSLINPEQICDKLTPFLKDGFDVIFVCMSAHLTGTYQSACIAKDMLEEDFPDRKINMIDSISASFGEGLLCIEASKMRDSGADIDEVTEWIENNRLRIRHIFTVDDLKYLKKGGRISGAAATVGSLLSIKPVLYATDDGTIDKRCVIRGRKKSLDALVNDYLEYVYNPSEQIIAIAHCDCKEDAEYIAKRIENEMPPKEIIIRQYDRCSGTHVGPGAMCLFFVGKDRHYND